MHDGTKVVDRAKFRHKFRVTVLSLMKKCTPCLLCIAFLAKQNVLKDTVGLLRCIVACATYSGEAPCRSAQTVMPRIAVEKMAWKRSDHLLYQVILYIF